MSGLFVATSMIVSAHEYVARPIVLSPLTERSTVYTHDGLVLGTLGTQDREIVELADVPESLVHAVVASEDRTFWENDGIDPGGLLRAFVANVSAGRVEEGGSTITQQLIKMWSARSRR
jgi:membrane peptidoglycan carboxypeptidase